MNFLVGFDSTTKADLRIEILVFVFVGLQVLLKVLTDVELAILLVHTSVHD